MSGGEQTVVWLRIANEEHTNYTTLLSANTLGVSAYIIA